MRDREPTAVWLPAERTTTQRTQTQRPCPCVSQRRICRVRQQLFPPGSRQPRSCAFTTNSGWQIGVRDHRPTGRGCCRRRTQQRTRLSSSQERSYDADRQLVAIRLSADHWNDLDDHSTLVPIQTTKANRPQYSATIQLGAEVLPLVQRCHALLGPDRVDSWRHTKKTLDRF